MEWQTLGDYIELFLAIIFLPIIAYKIGRIWIPVVWRKCAPRVHFPNIFGPLLVSFRATFGPLSQPTSAPAPDVKVARLGLLDDHALPADVLPEFEQPEDLIRWLATHTMISQGQVQTWFKGNTANLAYLVKDERDKYAKKHGPNLWSNESRRARATEQLADTKEARHVQSTTRRSRADSLPHPRSPGAPVREDP
jgi:hypothetical protein